MHQTLDTHNVCHELHRCESSGHGIQIQSTHRVTRYNYHLDVRRSMQRILCSNIFESELVRVNSFTISRGTFGRKQSIDSDYASSTPTCLCDYVSRRFSGLAPDSLHKTSHKMSTTLARMSESNSALCFGTPKEKTDQFSTIDKTSTNTASFHSCFRK